MENYKFIRSKSVALDIWNRREFYQLGNFSASDICRIYKEVQPDTSLMNRKNHYRSFINRFGDTVISNITSSDIKSWFGDIKVNGDFSERTLAQVKCQLSPFFKWLILEDIITDNPLTNIKFKRNVPPKRLRCVLSAKEVKELSEKALSFDSRTLYPYLYALIQTGARRSEVAKLTWDDVDLETGHLIFRNTKNGSDRKILIAQNLKKVISSQGRSSRFVFPNKDAEFFNRSAIARSITKFKEAHSINKDWHIHDLRHSFAYNFLKKGGEMYQLQALLGHRSIQMTVDLYGNLKSHDVKDPSPYDF